MKDIIIENLVKKYKDKLVLNNLSLNLSKNIKTVIMGKSGSGKTTLIRILLGLTEYDSGNIYNLEDKIISCLFQEDRLIPELSIYSNIRLVANISKDEIDGLLNEFLLYDSRNKKITELSGGMQRRISLIRTLIYPSNTVFLDEPLKGLDNDTKLKIIDKINKLLMNKLVLINTHSELEAKLFNGKIITL